MRQLLIKVTLPLFISLLSVCAANASLDSILEPLSINHSKASRAYLAKESNDKVSSNSKKIVKSHNNYISVLDVIKPLISELSNKFDIEGQIKLTPLVKWQEVVAGNNYQIVFSNLPSPNLRSTFTVSFKIISEGNEIGSYSMPVRCELWQNIYITNKRLNPASQIDRSDLQYRVVDVLKLQDKPLPIDIDLSLYEVSRAISANKPLLWKSVELKPHIRKGKLIDIVAQEGLMKISTKGIALENGLTNDFIAARNLNSRRDIQGQIIDEGTVKVHF